MQRLILSWFMAVTAEYLLLPEALRGLSDLQALGQMSALRVAVATLAGVLILTLLSKFLQTERLERWGLVLSFALAASLALRAAFRLSFLVLCAAMLIVLAVYGLFGSAGEDTPLPAAQRASKGHVWLTVGGSVVFFLFISLWTVGRVYSFGAPTYDFGIFSQMFYSMKETGLPLTTLERDGLLSHFAVHVSPIYYLLLPFYSLAPYPATLQVLQAAVMTSAVLPLWKLGTLHGLSGWQRTLLCTLLLLYPAFSGSAGYDLHENCFLTPLLLWLFYGLDRKKPAMTVLSALLTLAVKEDAAVYVAVLALWQLLRCVLRRSKAEKKEWAMSLLLLCLSVGWFFAVTGYLAKHGDGVMSNRYRNLMYDSGGSLVQVLLTVAVHPLKVLYECVDPEKLRYIALTMLPLLGLPLLTRRYERYLLLIPYVLVNLMSDYRYQHEIFYQYSFGSTACLFYLTVINLADWRKPWQRFVPLTGAVMLAAVCFGQLVVPRAMYYPHRCVERQEEYQQLWQALEDIPEEASVCATTFYTAALSQRETVYDVSYASREHLLQSEYVVLEGSSQGSYRSYATPGQENGLENLLSLLEQEGYHLICAVEQRLLIYRKLPTLYWHNNSNAALHPW